MRRSEYAGTQHFGLPINQVIVPPAAKALDKALRPENDPIVRSMLTPSELAEVERLKQISRDAGTKRHARHVQVASDKKKVLEVTAREKEASLLNTRRPRRHHIHADPLLSLRSQVQRAEMESQESAVSEQEDVAPEAASLDAQTAEVEVIGSDVLSTTEQEESKEKASEEAPKPPEKEIKTSSLYERKERPKNRPSLDALKGQKGGDVDLVTSKGPIKGRGRR